MDKYPSHRYHPSLDEGKYVVVNSEEEDEALKEQDENYRDTPYSAREREEYLKDPKAKIAQPKLVAPRVQPAVEQARMRDRVAKLESDFAKLLKAAGIDNLDEAAKDAEAEKGKSKKRSA